LQTIDRFESAIAELAPTLPDYSLFKSLPGTGPQLTPSLLTAFGEQRERFPKAEDLQEYAGSAQKALPTKRPSVPWHSSGFASFIAAEKPEQLTMKPAISTPYGNAAPRS
jgi:hypothetical protein